MSVPQIVIDLETLGNGNRAVITQIGAVAFDLDKGSPAATRRKAIEGGDYD